MIDHVMGKLEKIVDTSLNEEITYFVIIVVAIVVYGVFVRIKCLEDLKRTDLGRRKILKIMPYEILQDNKAFIFYLIKNFRKETQDIKNSI